MEFHVIWRRPTEERAHNVFLTFDELVAWLVNVIKACEEIEIFNAYARLENEKL